MLSLLNTKPNIKMKIKGQNITTSEIFRLFLLKNNDFDTTDEDNVRWFKEAIDANMVDHSLVWFRMFKGDTGATTVRNIIEDIVNQPSSHNNHKYMVECLEMAIENPSELEIYIDNY